ncbi:MAG: amidohydrolase [Acidimicrobiaceae bacterium]|nr:amidohydrolase [Acidimicrobiaceae bacterium]
MSDNSVLFIGGTIHTMGEGPRPDAVRVDGDRITAVGRVEELAQLGDATTLDLDGRCLMPGFVDAHTHPLMHGQCMSWADLSSAASMDEIVKILREHGRGLGAEAAIRGYGYDQHRLSEDRHPTRHDLDRVSESTDVTIMHTSGHGYVANTHTLAAAGITRDTPTPSGGLIDREDDGSALGRVFDSACDLLTGPNGVKITNHGPNFHLPDDAEVLDRHLDEAQELFLSAGITTVGDCQVTDREMTNYLRAKDSDRLKIRVSMYVLSSHSSGLHRLGITSQLGDEWLRIAGVKHYADGSLISGTAFLPCGCGATHGYLYHDKGDLEDQIALANEAGLQTATHAQGPEAIELILRGLERTPRPALRHRIEHCGFPTDQQLARMKTLGVVPVPQPTQIFRYGDGVRRDHPDLAERMYGSGLYRDAGLPIVLSSDAPVTLPDIPMACWAAETRRTSGGCVLGEAARISRQEAFAGYTSGGALALRRTDVGALAPGRFADLAILDCDPFDVATDLLPDVEIDETWVAGRRTWTATAGMINMNFDPY